MRFQRIGTALVSTAAVTVLAVSPASADTTVTFGISAGSGSHSASGSLTWLNRSVDVQGGVTDTGGAGTQVLFNGIADGYLVASQTRPTKGQLAVNETVSYAFTLDGSAYVGGITEVDIYIYDAHTGSWYGPKVYRRP